MDYDDLECQWLAEAYVGLYWDIFPRAEAMRIRPDPKAPELARKAAEAIRAGQKAINQAMPRTEWEELMKQHCPGAFYDTLSRWKGEALAGKKN